MIRLTLKKNIFGAKHDRRVAIIGSSIVSNGHWAVSLDRLSPAQAHGLKSADDVVVLATLGLSAGTVQRLDGSSYRALWPSGHVTVWEVTRYICRSTSGKDHDLEQVLVCNADGQIIPLSRAYCDALGVTAGTVLIGRDVEPDRFALSTVDRSVLIMPMRTDCPGVTVRSTLTDEQCASAVADYQSAPDALSVCA